MLDKMVTDQNNAFNKIMPESDDRCLCVEIDKPITGAGYDKNFLPRIQKMIDDFGEIRLLVYYKSFKGWEVEAAIEDMASLATYRNQLKKIALVNPPKSEIFKTKIRQPAISGEIQLFSTGQLKEAIAWVKE